MKAEANNLCKYLYDHLMIDSIHLPDRFMRSLESIIQAVRSLSCELRCQRGAYTVFGSIGVGDSFDSSFMQNVDLEMEAGESGSKETIVACILSDALVRCPYYDSNDVEDFICKARVLVAC